MNTEHLEQINELIKAVEASNASPELNNEYIEKKLL